MTGYHTTNRGRYKCDFCTQRSYKTVSGILNHVNKLHELEVTKGALEEMRGEMSRLKNQPPKVVEKVVYQEKPDPKYWRHNIFCTACKEVKYNAGIPFGQTIENTPCNGCGTRSLLPIEKGL